MRLVERPEIQKGKKPTEEILISRVTYFLRHDFESGMTTEEIAQRCKVPCKLVRKSVVAAKEQGWLQESAKPPHVLLRVRD